MFACSQLHSVFAFSYDFSVKAYISLGKAFVTPQFRHDVPLLRNRDLTLLFYITLRNFSQLYVSVYADISMHLLRDT